MTQKEKKLILKDLCARLPYGVKIERYDTYYGIVSEIDETYNKIDYFRDFVGALDITFLDKWIEEYNVKPYLFPLDKISGDMWSEYLATCVGSNASFPTLKSFEWCNEHHIDYRGLIPMGLAIDATNLNIY